MKNILLLLSITMLLSAGSKEASEDSTTQKAHIDNNLRKQLLNPSTTAKPKKEKTTAQSLGISIEGEKITIDTKQTKEFFKSFTNKIKDSFKDIETSLKKEQVESKNETGITITKTTMNIDLNKTKDFMGKWVKSMEGVINELDKSLGGIEQSLPEDKQ